MYVGCFVIPPVMLGEETGSEKLNHILRTGE